MEGKRALLCKAATRTDRRNAKISRSWRKVRQATSDCPKRAPLYIKTSATIVTRKNIFRSKRNA